MRILVPVFAMVATPAFAEVKSATPSGFELINVAIIDAPPGRVYALLGEPSRW